jgi:hypothetical protein
MPEQHVQLMKGLGFTEDEIKAVEALTPDQLKAWKADDPEQLKIFNPAALITSVQTGMKNKLSNDPEFLGAIPEDKINKDILKKIESGQYARFQNEIVEVAKKKLGLNDEEVLTAEDRKSIKAMVEKLSHAYAKKAGGAEGLQQLQKEKAEALQALDEMKTQQPELLKKEIEKVTGASTMKIIKTLTKVELMGLEDVRLGVGASILSEPALQLLNAKYTVVLDENDNLDLKQKGNPALDVMDDKGKKLTFAQGLRAVVLENKLGAEIKEDEKKELKKKKLLIEGGGGDDDEPVVVDGHIAAKIAANKS